MTSSALPSFFLRSLTMALAAGTLTVAAACPVATGVTIAPESEPETTPPECVAVTAGDIVVDDQQDVQTIYSAVIDDDLGSVIIDDFLVFNFVNFNERFGLAGIGTFPLDSAPNDNRGTCAECISVFVDQESPNAVPAKVFFQTAGTIVVDQNPREGVFQGTVTGLELREATIDPATLESTLVPGGDCLTVADFSADVRAVPNGWTCDPETYNDGAFCDCTCGTYDPDCSCDPFTGEDCSQPIQDDCGAGEICTIDGCEASCDMFSSSTDCSGGLCIHSSPFPVCADIVLNTDAAALGAACAGPLEEFEPVYCGIDGSIPTGMCDDTTGNCAPTCDNDARCASGEYCIILDTSGGYCRQGPPNEWFNCDGALWSDGIACDCGCGIADPDCADDTLPVNGCGDGEICFDGVCE